MSAAGNVIFRLPLCAVTLVEKSGSITRIGAGADVSRIERPALCERFAASVAGKPAGIVFESVIVTDVALPVTPEKASVPLNEDALRGIETAPLEALIGSLVVTENGAAALLGAAIGTEVTELCPHATIAQHEANKKINSRARYNTRRSPSPQVML